MRFVSVLSVILAFGVFKLPAERAIFAQHRQEHFGAVDFNLDLREQIGQLGFIAALSGFRAALADILFVQAHVAWERTEWGRVLLLFRQVTMLQGRTQRGRHGVEVERGKMCRIGQRRWRRFVRFQRRFRRQLDLGQILGSVEVATRYTGS